MITRLYADNFKTLVNFELSLGPMNLLLGVNGSGKSNVLEIIRLIRSFVCEDETSTAMFPSSSLCRWETRVVQTFELDIRDQKGFFTYRLEIEHDIDNNRCRVKSEQLSFNQRPLYSSSLSDAQLLAQLYHDDGKRGPEVLSDWNRSGVGRLQPRNDNKLLTSFRNRLEKSFVIRINPDKILAESETEDVFLNADMSNFAAWYRHLVQDQPNRVFELTETLRKDVLDGFLSLRLTSVGEKSRALWAKFGVQANETVNETDVEYRFGELSDGQRSLIALYALAICSADEENTLCLDHPENCLALPEIQPWLTRLADAAEEGRCQAIIATHHPELINLLAANSGYWLERQSGGPTRVKRIGDQDASGLPLSELIARGWLHG
jgi:predicted ATPase